MHSRRGNGAPARCSVVCAGNSAADLEGVHGSFGFPVIGRPRREGSGLGVAKATNLSELAQAIECALGYDSSVLVERFIEAKEVAVGILDGRVLGAIEIAPRSGLYAFHATYTPGMTAYHIPPPFPSARHPRVVNLAVPAATAL